MDVKKEMDAVCKALREDAEYYQACQANIAMAFVDEWREADDHEIHPLANRAAKRFLDMLVMERN